MTHGWKMLVALGLAAPLAVTTGSSPALAVVEAETSQCVDVPGATEGDVAVINITPTRAAASGFGALRPFGAAPVYDRPADEQYSSVNFAANTPANPNLALVTTGPGGRICYDAGVASHDVLLDVAAVIPAANINATDPTRLTDTRDGTTQIAPDTSLCLTVPNASPGDVAVINITPTRAAGTGFGSLRAQGTTPIYDRSSDDSYSSVNFAANAPANPNLSFVTVGTSSEICYDGGAAFHDVIVDLSAILPAATVIAAEPRRLYDSRTRQPIQPGTTVCFAVPEAAAGDVAVVNITPVRAQGQGFGAMIAGGEAPVTERPAAEQFSSVNFASGTPANPNLAVVKVSDSGFICYNGALSAHDVIIDVATIITSDSINAIDPSRLTDTRDPNGAIPIRIELGYTLDHPVNEAYPTPPLTSIGQVSNGHTAGRIDDEGRFVEVGAAVGYIVDNGDGTVSGAGFIEERAQGASSEGRSSDGSSWSYDYPGFAITCSELGSLKTPPGLYVFDSYIPVVFSGTVELFAFNDPFYNISMSFGVGATPGEAGAVPELDLLVDTMDTCGADFAECTSRCGSVPFPTYESVEVERDQFVVDHLRINQALVETGVINVDGLVQADPTTHYQYSDADDDRVRTTVTLG